jgi:rubrerythrin
MIEEAEAEGVKGALRSFSSANEVEKIHADLYQKALDSLGSNEEVDYYVCEVCGYTAEGEPPDRCPVCNVTRQMFKKIE